MNKFTVSWLWSTGYFGYRQEVCTLPTSVARFTQNSLAELRFAFAPTGLRLKAQGCRCGYPGKPENGLGPTATWLHLLRVANI